MLFCVVSAAATHASLLAIQNTRGLFLHSVCFSPHECHMPGVDVNVCALCVIA